MYSIKTDLDITGAGTVGKDLLVKGNAVFKGNLTVDGTVSFANATFTAITASTLTLTSTLDVTGKANLSGGMDVKGNTVIGDPVVGSDTLTVNSNVVVNGKASFADDITQTAGKAILQETQVSTLDVLGETKFEGDITAATGTTATFDSVVAKTIKADSVEVIDITSTGDATFENLTVNGTLGGDFDLSNINTQTLNVTGQSNLQGPVSLGGNITGANSTATFRDVRIGPNSAGTNYRVSFSYSVPGQRPTVILQNEVQTETISSDQIVNQQTAIFGNPSLSTYGITGNGLNKLDYLTVSGNSIQSQNTPLLEVTRGLTKVADLEVTGTANLKDVNASGNVTVENLTVNGVFGGDFDLDEINATSISISGQSSFTGSVNLGGALTGANTSAVFNDIKLGRNAADVNVRYSFNYTAPGQRPTVILQNEVQTETISSDQIVNQGTATFGNASASSYGITGNGLNTMDYLSLTGNSIQSPNTPRLQVNGKSVLHDVEFTGTVTGLDVDISGQTVTPEAVDATGAIKGKTLESIEGTKVGTTLEVGSDATIRGDVSAVDATFTGNLEAVEGTFSGDVEVTGQTLKVVDLVVTGTVTGVTADANVDGLDIAPNKVDVTTDLTVNGDSSLKGVSVSTLTSAGSISGETVSATSFSGGSVSVTGAVSATNITTTTLTAPTINGNTTFSNDVTIIGTLTPGEIDLSGTAIDALSIKVTQGAELTGNTKIAGDLEVTGNVDLSGAEVTALSLTSTGKIVSEELNEASILPKLSSDEITVDTLSASEASIGTLNATSAELASASVSGTLTAPTIANAAGIELANNTKVTGNLEVTGTLTPGEINLANTEIIAKSIKVSEGADITGNSKITGDLEVTGSVDLSAADVTVESLTSTGKIVSNETVEASVLPKLSSTEITVGTLGATTANITTLNVAGTSNLHGVDVDGAITATTLTVPNVTGNTTFANDVTILGTLIPTGIDLSGTAIDALSITVTQGADITGNAKIDGDLEVTGSVDLSEAEVTVKSLTTEGVIVSSNVVDSNILPKLSSTEIDVTTLTATTGTIGTLSSTNATVDATLTAKDVVSETASVSGVVSVGSLTSATDTVAIAKNTNINGDLHVVGTLTAGEIDLTGTELEVASLTTTAGADIKGDLVVGGTIDLSGTDITAINITSTETVTVGTDLILSSGKIQGSPEISGNTTFKGTITAESNASIAGTTTLGGALTVSTGGIQVNGGNLNIPNGGIDVYGIVSRGQTSLKATAVDGTLTVTGNASLNGGFSATTGKIGSTLDVTGAAVFESDVTVKGVFYPEGGLDLTGAAIEAESLDLTTTLNADGAATLGSTLNVTGAATLGSTLDVTGNTIIRGTLDSGAITADSVAADGAITADSIDVDTTARIGTNATVGGTLGVTGATTLGAVQASNNFYIGAKSVGRAETVQITTGPEGMYINGDVFCNGKLNAQFDISGQEIQLKSLLVDETITSVGNITSNARIIANAATIGEAGSQNDNLLVNGNVVCKGDFTVEGVLKATLDQSESAVEVGSLQSNAGITATGAISGNSLTITTTGSFGGKVTMSGGAEVTGALSSTGLLSSAGGLTVSAGATTVQDLTAASISTVGVATLGATTMASATVSSDLTVTGVLTANGNIVLGSDAADTLTVNAASTFKEHAVFEDGITIEGGFETDAAEFTTATVSTKKYSVIPSSVTASTVAATGTWTPDGSTNVYRIVADRNFTIGQITGLIGGGKATSTYIYIQQDAVGNHEVTFDGTFAQVGEGLVNGTSNSVTIVQLVYDGFSSVVDMFIAQRTA